MVSIGVGVILGITKYVFFIKTKSSQNKEMMELLSDSLQSLDEVLSILGTVNPTKISFDVKRKIEILVDKLSRYIHKRLKKSIFTRQFKLQTERNKTKIMMNQLILLLNELQIIYLNDSISKLGVIGEKIDIALYKLDQIEVKIDKITDTNIKMVQSQKLLLYIRNSFSNFKGQIFDIIDINKENDLDNLEKNKIYRCIKSYFRANQAIKEGIDPLKNFLKNLKISQQELIEFRETYITSDLIKHFIYTEKIALHLPDGTNPSLESGPGLYFLALDPGHRKEDFKKGDLLKIEGPILRSNIKYSYISRY